VNAEHAGIAWGGEPNPDRDFPRVVRPRPGVAVRGVVLSSKAELVRVHWLDGRSTPHLLAPHRCPGCEARTRYRLVAYLATWIHGYRTWSLVEIPEEATRECLDALSGARGPLRGMHLCLARTTAAVNSRVWLTWEPPTGSPDSLPEPPDVRAALTQLWSQRLG
jgi:hypothetical protein